MKQDLTEFAHTGRLQIECITKHNRRTTHIEYFTNNNVIVVPQAIIPSSRFSCSRQLWSTRSVSGQYRSVILISPVNRTVRVRMTGYSAFSGSRSPSFAHLLPRVSRKDIAFLSCYIVETAYFADTDQEFRVSLSCLSCM